MKITLITFVAIFLFGAVYIVFDASTVEMKALASLLSFGAGVMVARLTQKK